MYIQCNLEFILERPKAIARPWWILQKIFFVTFKRFIPKQFFSWKRSFSESTHGLRTASKNRSKTYAAPCIILIFLLFFAVVVKSSAFCTLLLLFQRVEVLKLQFDAKTWLKHFNLFEIALTVCKKHWIWQFLQKVEEKWE